MSGALGRLLRDALETSPHPVRASGGGQVMPPALLAQADALTAQLHAKGVAPAEPILVTVPNMPADLAAFLSVWEAGGVAVPIHAGAASVTRAAVEGASAARLRIRDGTVEETGSPAPERRPLLDTAALIIFTSGSTGQPKGVVICHDRFAAKIKVLRQLIELGPEDHLIVPLQLTFIFGLWTSILALSAGARLTLVPRFSPAALASAIREGGTVLAAVPSMLRSMTAVPDGGQAGALRAILTGGEALGPALADALSRTYPLAGVFDLYGLTETGSCDFVLAPQDSLAGHGTIGCPTEGVLFRIAGDEGEAPLGKTGELQIRTPYGMLGYLDQPELTASSFQDGYFRSGDLARIDAAGHVVLVGRAKEIVSRGGNKIAPLEIDNLLCRHPQIAGALCAGVPDARLGERLHAVVVPKPGIALAPEVVRAWLAERIERFKIPDVIEIADALPTGPTGKASRAALIERLGASD